MRIFDGRTAFSQWDVNMKITDDSFKVGEEIHFHNGTTKNALVLLTYEYEGSVVVDVPNILLTTYLPIKVYRCSEDRSCFCTMETCKFEVKPRPKPDDYIYTETECITIQDYVDRALEEAKESGEFDGKDGKDGNDGNDGKDGNDGAPGADGYTPQKGIDYWTPDDKQEIVASVIAQFTYAEGVEF